MLRKLLRLNWPVNIISVKLIWRRHNFRASFSSCGTDFERGVKRWSLSWFITNSVYRHPGWPLRRPHWPRHRRPSLLQIEPTSCETTVPNAKLTMSGRDLFGTLIATIHGYLDFLFENDLRKMIRGRVSSLFTFCVCRSVFGFVSASAAQRRK